MKKNIFKCLFIGCLFLQVACTLEASFGSDGYASRLSISTLSNNSDGSISLGGYLSLSITGEDGDGISQITVVIPSLNVDQEFTNRSNDERWTIDQTFAVEVIDFNAPREIYVTLIDNDGREYTRTIGLLIHG